MKTVMTLTWDAQLASTRQSHSATVVWRAPGRASIRPLPSTSSALRGGLGQQYGEARPRLPEAPSDPSDGSFLASRAAAPGGARF